MKKMGSFGRESGLGEVVGIGIAVETKELVPFRFSPAGICGGWRSPFS